VDLAAVSSVDSEGKEFLTQTCRRRSQAGVSSRLLMHAMADEIEHEAKKGAP
jgi:hypothetical protein